jgi:hypothetical protein
MLDLTENIKRAENEGRFDERWIHSLRSLLRNFGLTFELKRKLSLEEALRLRKQGKPIPFQEGIKVAASSRNTQLPLTDSEVVYVVTKCDRRALKKGETIGDVLYDLCHAASCGCAGCWERIFARWKKYQKLVKPTSA